MRSVRWGAGIGALVAVLVGMGASCGDDDDDGGQAAPPQVDPDPVRLEIQSVTLPQGPNPRPVVRFRVTDAAGTPIDLVTEIGNSATTPATFPSTVPRFTLAQLDDRGNYTSYYANTNVQPVAAGPTTWAAPASETPPVAAPATQALSVTVRAADLAAVGDPAARVYDWTMPATQVTGLDLTKTHTLAGWVTRARSALDTDITDASFNFVPLGGAAAERDEVVTDAACNRCHGGLQAHGTRRGVQLCITCHSPQTSDPETSRTVDFQVMVHKIHMGANLPSVAHRPTPTSPGNPYYIVGFRNSVHDYSDVTFPWHDGVQHCTACHTGGEDAENWRTRPSATACTSCHDNVKFAQTSGDATRLPACNTLPTTTPLADCLHSGGAIAGATTAPGNDDFNSCVGCHAPGSGLAVDRFHHGD